MLPSFLGVTDETSPLESSTRGLQDRATARLARLALWITYKAGVGPGAYSIYWTHRKLAEARDEQRARETFDSGEARV